MSTATLSVFFIIVTCRRVICCCYHCCLVAKSCPTLCDPMDFTMPGFLSFTISQTLLKLMSIESVMPSNYLFPCCPLLLPSVFPSIRVFSNESALHVRWPSFGALASASVLLMNIQGLISFRIDCFDLLAVQGTL